ncbi:hypothetical protein E143388_07549 [Rhodococcus opacus]|nr:hypothetical protein E143388_07549 [Rhodococcus opacus]
MLAAGAAGTTGSLLDDAVGRTAGTAALNGGYRRRATISNNELDDLCPLLNRGYPFAPTIEATDAAGGPAPLAGRNPSRFVITHAETGCQSTVS